jgi:thiol-disulfide isomerase/thioredoxin
MRKLILKMECSLDGYHSHDRVSFMSTELKRSASRRLCPIAIRLLVSLQLLVPSPLHSQAAVQGHLVLPTTAAPIAAQVHIVRPPDGVEIASTNVTADGKFNCRLSTPGLWFLDFTVPSYRTYRLPLYLLDSTDISVDVSLATYQPLPYLDTICVIGEFNAFDWTKPRTLTKLPDGTYRASIPWSKPTMAYQIIGFEKSGRSINNPAEPLSSYDGNGDHQSLAQSRDGKIEIRFDPKMVPLSPKEESVVFHAPQAFVASAARILRDRQSIMDQYAELKRQGRTKEKSIAFQNQQWTFTEATAWLRDNAFSCNDPNLATVYVVCALTLSREIESDTLLAKKCLQSVAPDSPLWSLQPAVLGPRLRNSLGIAATRTYLNQVLERNPNPETIAFLLADALLLAKMNGVEKDKAPARYAQLLRDYPESPFTEMAKKGLKPESRLAVGSAIPEASFPDLFDSARLHHVSRYQGKVLLLDFWATWCAPCIKAIPDLERAYELYHNMGLEILNISFDHEAKTAAEYCRTKKTMPWDHSFAPIDRRIQIQTDFEFVTFPHTILVDRNGHIRAIGSELMGDRLLRQLETVMK